MNEQGVDVNKTLYLYACVKILKHFLKEKKVIPGGIGGESERS